MKKYRISPLMLMLMAAFIVIDGSWFALYAVVCSLWHELWHMLALRMLGGNTRSLSVRQFGMGLKTDGLGYGGEAVVALAGPAASLLAFAVFGICARYFVFNKETVFLCFSNLAIFFLNILPIFPLDGGRALHCMLCMGFELNRARLITRVISVIFLLPLGAVSVIILVRTGYNLSLMIICIYLAMLLIGVKDI